MMMIKKKKRMIRTNSFSLVMKVKLGIIILDKKGKT